MVDIGIDQFWRVPFFRVGPDTRELDAVDKLAVQAEVLFQVPGAVDERFFSEQEKRNEPEEAVDRGSEEQERY
jgi:hypothetical protein